MTEALHEETLTGRFLLAMPGMGDPRFDRSVIYMLAHDAQGAMGFIVNQPTDGLTLGDIASNLPESVALTGLRNLPVFIGGPVQSDHGFVLHSDDYTSLGQTQFDTRLPVRVTQSLQILVDAARANGPAHMRLLLGYTGWGPGQLEGEIQENAWFTCPADMQDMFSADTSGLYEKCVSGLGIDLALLSAQGGEA
jgi:putative transcriptional regulator